MHALSDCKQQNLNNMRIRIIFNANNVTIPFNHQHLLAGLIHKWLGENNKLHGKISLFSFSRLEGAKNTKTGLEFKQHGYFFFSANDPEVINLLMKGVFKDKTMFHGLEVEEIAVTKDPEFNSTVIFNIGSPILIKRFSENKVKHFIYNDLQTDELLKETLLSKMKLIGLEDETLDIHFDRNYSKASTKLVDYNGIKNRANWCPVIISGKPETLLFAWNVGLGNSTGIGFGAVK